MARDTGVRITGLRETIRDLERLGVSVQDLKEAFRDIAEDTVADARTLVRVDTGRLRGSIRPGTAKNKAIVRAGSAAVPYAARINYARPGDLFLNRAADQDLAGKVQAIEANLSRLIARYT